MPSNEQYLAVMAPDNGINNKDPVNLIKDSAWSDGNNVRFGSGYVEKAGGWDTFGNDPAPWQSNIDYAVGDYCVPNTANGHVYKCSAVGAAPTTAATFTRASVAYKNDGSQVGVEGTTNLLPTGSENFVTGWVAGGGNTITVTDYVDTIPGIGPVTCKRIQSTGGTIINKYYIAVYGLANPHTTTISLYGKLLSGNTKLNTDGGNQPAFTSSWQRLTATVNNYAANYSNISFLTTLASDSFDILVYQPQMELKPYATPYVPPGTSRAAINDIPRFESNGLTMEEGTTNIASKEPTNISDLYAYSLVSWNNGVYFANNSGTLYAVVGATFAANTAYTMSVDIKMDDGSVPVIGVSTNPSADFTLVIANNGISPSNCFVISLGNNVYRVSGTYAPSAASSAGFGIYKYTGQSAKGFTVIGRWQVEAKAYPTSYIPAGQTRSAESCTTPASVVNISQGTISFDVIMNPTFKQLVSGRYPYLFSMIGNNTSNFVRLYHSATGAWFNFDWSNSSGGSAMSGLYDAVLPDGKRRITFRWSGTTVTLYVDGILKGIITNCKMPSEITAVRIGCEVFSGNVQANTQFSNLHISNVARSDSWIAANGTPGQAIPIDGYTSAYFPLSSNLTGIMPLYSYIRSQPTFPLSGTVADGPATWSEVGSNKLDGAVQVIDNYYKYNGDSYLMVITTRKVYYYDDQSKVFVDITGTTPLTGDAKTPVFTENAQNYFVFTNGKDPVKYWNGTGNIANLPGLTDVVPWNDGGSASVVTAKSLLYAKNFLLLFGTTESNGTTQLDYPQRLRWSALGDITVWKNSNQELQDKQAGWADLTDGVDWAQCLATLGNYIVAYKERSIQVISYVGGDQTWDKWPAIQGTGLLAPKALMNLGDEHIFIGPDNVYSFDLREVMIAGDDIARRFFDVLDPDNTSLCNSFYFEEIPEGGFNFVSTTSPDGYPDKAIAYNTDTKAWSWRDMPMLCYGYYNLADNPIWDNQDYVWDEAEGGWDSSKKLANAPINLCGDAQGFIYWFNGHSKDGGDLDCFIQTKLFDFGNPVLMKRAIRLQLMISREGAYNLPVYVGTAANVDEPITWYGPYNMSLDKTPRRRGWILTLPPVI